jgi:hypothetical protein
MALAIRHSEAIEDESRACHVRKYWIKRPLLRFGRRNLLALIERLHQYDAARASSERALEGS